MSAFFTTSTRNLLQYEAAAGVRHHTSAAPAGPMTPLALRVRGEYREMPGLRLTVRQAARLFSVAPDVVGAVFDELQHASILAHSDDGTYSLIDEP